MVVDESVGHLRLARAAEDFGQDFNQMVPATVEIIVALRSFQAQEIEQTVKITDRFLNWGSRHAPAVNGMKFTGHFSRSGS